MELIKREERFTARTLIKWRPSELQFVQQWCWAAGVDVSLLIRGATIACVRNPLRAIELIHLPMEVVERAQQTELPLIEPSKASEKPVQKASKSRKAPNRQKGARREP